MNPQTHISTVRETFARALDMELTRLVTVTPNDTVIPSVNTSSIQIETRNILLPS